MNSAELNRCLDLIDRAMRRVAEGLDPLPEDISIEKDARTGRVAHNPVYLRTSPTAIYERATVDDFRGQDPTTRRAFQDNQIEPAFSVKNTILCNFSSAMQAHPERFSVADRDRLVEHLTRLNLRAFEKAKRDLTELAMTPLNAFQEPANLNIMPLPLSDENVRRLNCLDRRRVVELRKAFNAPGLVMNGEVLARQEAVTAEILRRIPRDRFRQAMPAPRAAVQDPQPVVPPVVQPVLQGEGLDGTKFRRTFDRIKHDRNLIDVELEEPPEDTLLGVSNISNEIVDNPRTLTTNRRAFYTELELRTYFTTRNEFGRLPTTDPSNRAPRASFDNMRPAFCAKNVFLVAARNGMLNHPAAFTEADALLLAEELRLLDEPETIEVAEYYLEQFYSNPNGVFPNIDQCHFPIPNPGAATVSQQLGLAALDRVQAAQLATVLNRQDVNIRPNQVGVTTVVQLRAYVNANRHLFTGQAAAQPQVVPPVEHLAIAWDAVREPEDSINFGPVKNPVMLSTSPTSVHEREAVKDWIQRNGRDPLTRAPVTVNNIMPAFSARNVLLIAARNANRANPASFTQEDSNRVRDELALLNPEAILCAEHYLQQFCTNGRAVYDPLNKLTEANRQLAQRTIFKGADAGIAPLLGILNRDGSFIRANQAPQVAAPPILHQAQPPVRHQQPPAQPLHGQLAADIQAAARRVVEDQQRAEAERQRLVVEAAQRQQLADAERQRLERQQVAAIAAEAARVAAAAAPPEPARRRPNF